MDGWMFNVGGSDTTEKRLIEAYQALSRLVQACKSLYNLQSTDYCMVWSYGIFPTYYIQYIAPPR